MWNYDSLRPRMESISAPLESAPVEAGFGRPLLVVAGLPRTSTTALFENLARNPGFSRAQRKELNYFLRACGQEATAEYEALFAHWKTGQICLDISPYYSLDPKVPLRIKKVAPNAHVVLLLREPVEWLFSLYVQLVSHRPYSQPTFAEFALGSMAASIDGMPERSFGGDLYAATVRAFETAFGGRLLLLDYAYVKSDFAGALKRIEAFAGAPSWFDAQNVDGRFFNSSNAAQQSSAFVRYLVSRAWVTRLAPKVFPARLIEFVRARLFLTPREKIQQTGISAADGVLAQDLMRENIAFYKALFSAGPSRIGRDQSDQK